MNENDTYRVDRATVRGDLPILLMLLADLFFGLWAWRRMPARVPIHWNFSGQVDAWGPPWENAFLLPLIGVAVYLLLLFLPLIDPRRASYALFGGTLRFFRGVIVLFLVGIHVAVTLASIGRAVDVATLARFELPLLFILLGNQMGRLRPNWFVGIRVPWTMDSEEVWTRTHRMAGPVWVVGGFVALAGAFLRPGAAEAVFLSVVAILVVVPIVYSYRLYHRLASEGRIGASR